MLKKTLKLLTSVFMNIYDIKKWSVMAKYLMLSTGIFEWHLQVKVSSIQDAIHDPFTTCFN